LSEVGEYEVAAASLAFVSALILERVPTPELNSFGSSSGPTLGSSYLTLLKVAVVAVVALRLRLVPEIPTSCVCLMTFDGDALLRDFEDWTSLADAVLP
jgi:hypothetical protein